MKIIDKTTTKLLANTISGDYDTYEGWEEQLKSIDDEKSILVAEDLDWDDPYMIIIEEL